MINIYVDGSYNNGTTTYAYIVLYDDRIIKQFRGVVPKNECYGSRNIAGELTSVIKALEYCQNNDIKIVSIFYDYTGIECWAKRKWKAKKTVSKNYVNNLKQFNNIKIYWHKVSAHSNNKWNNYVDSLANN